MEGYEREGRESIKQDPSYLRQLALTELQLKNATKFVLHLLFLKMHQFKNKKFKNNKLKTIKNGDFQSNS